MMKNENFEKIATDYRNPIKAIIYNIFNCGYVYKRKSKSGKDTFMTLNCNTKNKSNLSVAKD